MHERGGDACVLGDAKTRESMLARGLRELLCAPDFPTRDLDAELERLERRHGGETYTEWVHHLAHLRFVPEEARRHWKNILGHRASLESRLGCPVDPRVALLDYFLGVERRLDRPKIVEQDTFDRTHASAFRDELTGLHNYRSFIEQLKREVARSRRDSSPLSLLMIDADDFKRYNDEHGHNAGNTALSVVGRVLRESIRDEDLAARFGGEEFAVILPGTPKTGAREVAERTRYQTERYGFVSAADGRGRLTISVGVATFPADAMHAEELIRRADQALYAAKASGKNRVELYGGSRRSHRRREIRLRGRIRALSPERHELTTAKISEVGIQLVSDCEFAPGTLVEVDLDLPDCEMNTRIPARVLYTRKSDCGSFETVVRTTDVEMPERAALLEYLRG